jgi:hypothetical protein
MFLDFDSLKIWVVVVVVVAATAAAITFMNVAVVMSVSFSPSHDNEHPRYL